jgi:hypothetical protein
MADFISKILSGKNKQGPTVRGSTSTESGRRQAVSGAMRDLPIPGAVSQRGLNKATGGLNSAISTMRNRGKK